MTPPCLLRGLTLIGCASALTAAACGGQSPPADAAFVDGIRIGHVTLDARPTGCTVILAPEGAVGAVDVRGGAPGTREIGLLDPVNTVQEVHAVVLSGGSAFGLDAASGAVRWLDEQGIGYPVGAAGVVPIVTSAILFDLSVGGDPGIRPGPECGYAAASMAEAAWPAEGSVGAGAGATVGKSRGMGRAMKGGIGAARLARNDGLVVAAIVAVNAVGDVVDPATGAVVAGVRTDDGAGLADARRLLREGIDPDPSPGANTTIGVVLTNAPLTKAQATKVAQMAQDGLARAIVPAHTPSDGDALFALATGSYSGEINTGVVGALAAEAVSEAILRAVREATGLPGLPAVREMGASDGRDTDPDEPSH